MFFFCVNEPADDCGGETPLVKNSELISKLDPEVLQKFEEKQIRYVRYLPGKDPGAHLSWQSAFLTSDRKVRFEQTRQSFWRLVSQQINDIS